MSNPELSETLRHQLAEWTDFDFAAHSVAVSLGIAPSPNDRAWGGKKWMYWSSNPLGEGLHQMLEVLSKNGVLEKDEEEQKYRWNQNFQWENYGENKK